MAHEIRLYSIQQCVHASRCELQRIEDTKDWRFRKNNRNNYLRALVNESIKRGYIAVGTAKEMREKFGKYFDIYPGYMMERDTRKQIWSLWQSGSRNNISVRWCVIY